MKPVDRTVADVADDGLALSLGGRTYSEEVAQDGYGRLLRMGLPPEMNALSDMLISNSQLLPLPPDSERPAIYDAYGQDLALMARYRDAFKICIDAAVRARAAPGQNDAQAFLDRMVATIAPVLHEPTLSLDSEALKLEPGALIGQLQRAFRVDVENLKQNVAVWFHLLAEHEYVSLIEWLNPTALRYHFFRMEATRDELNRQVEHAGNFIEGVTTTTTTSTRVRLFKERHTHVVVNASIQRSGRYYGRVPKRVALLIDKIPTELRPFLTIIDGQLTHEEVRRRVASDRVEVETHSIYRPDPALALFNTWAITGWGGSIAEPSHAIYRGHPLSRANKFLIGSLAATLAVAMLVEPLGGIRASIVVAAIGLILTGLSQAGMRLEARMK